MKLKYEKPSMVIEKFEMCQNIAYGCDTEYINNANHRTEYDCAWEELDYGFMIWKSEKCEFAPEEIDICYNAPESGIVAFAS